MCKLRQAWKNNYRPQTKLWKGNVFTPVCQSFCSYGGCLPQCMLGYTLPWADTPLGRHPLPLGRYPPPPGQTPPAQCMLGYKRPLLSACWDTHTPLPSACWDRHGYCCERYASYWKAFLFLMQTSNSTSGAFSKNVFQLCESCPSENSNLWRNLELQQIEWERATFAMYRKLCFKEQMWSIKIWSWKQAYFTFILCQITTIQSTDGLEDLDYSTENEAWMSIKGRAQTKTTW